MTNDFEKSAGGIKQEELPARRRNIAEQTHEAALSGESFEDAARAVDEVQALQNFRKALAGKSFGSFYDIFEDLTNINKALIGDGKKNDKIMELIEGAEAAAARFSPRVADLYLSILAEIGRSRYETKYKETAEKMADLKKEGDLEGLISGAASWDLKLNFIEQRLIGYLSGARALDRREGREMDDDVRKWREEQLKKAPSTPPERRNESKPGMDEMERLKEGERAPAIWSIHPAYGGYYREQSFSRWDSGRNTWVEDEYEYKDAERAPFCENEDLKKGVMNIVMRAEVLGGRWTSLPLPYTHGIYKVKAGEKECYIQQDQNGDLVVMAEGDGKVEIEVILSPKKDKIYGPTDAAKIKAPQMPAEFSEETKSEIERIKNSKTGNLARAWALSSYTRRHLTYSNESKYNSIYDSHPKGYFAAIDEHKQVDCDVGNTYFAALCSKLNIPVRHCVGHSVKGKDMTGSANITCGTGHAWSEVWDEENNRWARIDATPAGDPNLEEEKSGGESVPGDYGEQEAIRPTDEQLEELRKKLEERKEKLSYTKEERQIAEATGIELKEARQIVKEINEAERTRLSNGELAVDVMARLFDAIAESRKRELPAFTGPVRRSEGGEAITNFIAHYIGAEAGETDPMSRERSVTEVKEEKLLNGVDVYVIGDKSGSMRGIADGEALWNIQRKFEYLLFGALYRFNYDLEKAHLPAEKGLDVRTMGISFRGDNIEDIDLDKPLSPRFTAEDKVRMWHSLGEAGGGNGDVTAISYLYQKIKEEKEEMARQGIEDNRLRVVVAYSDGGYVGAEAEMRAWTEQMSKLKTVVVGIGLTESAATVPIVMHNPPKSFGEVVSNMDELVVATARHIVMQAIKLFPEKARQDAIKLIEEIINKFSIIKK